MKPEEQNFLLRCLRQKDLESSVEIMSKSPLIPSMSGGVGLGIYFAEFR